MFTNNNIIILTNTKGIEPTTYSYIYVYVYSCVHALCLILYSNLYKVVFDVSDFSIQRDDDLLYFPLMDVALNVKRVLVPQLNVTNPKVGHHLLNSLW